MKLYRIARWNEVYENNRSRQVKELSWVPIQNKMDGENFTQIMTHPKGATIFAAFILMVELASKSDPRGCLVRGNGRPHDVTTMSAKCRCPASWFTISIDYLISNTDWLQVSEIEDEAPCRQEGDVDMTPDCQSGDEGMEGKEENGRNGKEQPATSGFGEFWAQYPKKMAKGDAERAWTKMKCSAIVPQILTAIRKAKISTDWTKEFGQFIPHPATWLNRKGWEDEFSTNGRSIAPAVTDEPL